LWEKNKKTMTADGELPIGRFIYSVRTRMEESLMRQYQEKGNDAIYEFQGVKFTLDTSIALDTSKKRFGPYGLRAPEDFLK